MSRTGSLLVLAVASTALAQPPTRLDQLGAVVKSQPDFYGAIAGAGETVRVEWKLSAVHVELGGSVELTLTVRNAVNPRELIRPDLTKVPDFKDKFSLIEPVFDPQPAEDAKAVEFVYKLRPRDEGRLEIVPPKYRYFSPRAPKGRELQSAFVEPLSLTVAKPKVKAVPTLPLSGPDSFFAPASGSYTDTGSVPQSYWRALLVGSPLGLVGWLLVWRRLFPDAARLAKLRRIRAVRRTLDRLRAARRATDPAGTTAAAFRYYLSTRYGLSPVAATPSEVAAGLQELTVPAERVAEADELLRRCDAERFAPTPTRTAVADAAIHLVERWEGGPP